MGWSEWGEVVAPAAAAAAAFLRVVGQQLELMAEQG